MSQRFYPGSGRNWSTLDSVQLQFNGLTATFLGNRSIHTPAEYSYHCQIVSSFQDPLLVSNNATGNASDWRLNFIDFQVQLHVFSSYHSIFCVAMGFFLIIKSLKSFYHYLLYLFFYDTDSGLWFGQESWKLLLRQWLCRLLLPRDLDGTADHTASAVDFRVRPAYDHEFKHNGSVRWPQGSNNFSASVRVTHSRPHTLLCPTVSHCTSQDGHTLSLHFCTCFFLSRYFSRRMTFSVICFPVFFFP